MAALFIFLLYIFSEICKLYFLYFKSYIQFNLKLKVWVFQYTN